MVTFLITKGSIGQALSVLNLALDSHESNISPSSPHEVSVHVENAIHFWVWKFRKVSSYTLLNGSRLPWPLSYCFGSQALFRSTIPRDGAYYVAWRFIPYRQICLPKDSHWERSLVSFSIVVFSNFPCPYPKVIVRWRIDYQPKDRICATLGRWIKCFYSPNCTRHRYDALLQTTSIDRSWHISLHSHFPRHWDEESSRARFTGADACCSRAL